MTVCHNLQFRQLHQFLKENKNYKKFHKERNNLKKELNFYKDLFRKGKKKVKI